MTVPCCRNLCSPRGQPSALARPHLHDTVKDAEEGQTVEFDKVLLVDNDGAVTVGAPTVEGAKVVAEVKNPLVKGDKVIIFKMKRRKDSRKKNGHRQQYTEVEIKSVTA